MAPQERGGGAGAGRPPPPKTNSAATFASGAAAGMFTSALLQPLDVIKTRLQMQTHAAGGPRGMLGMGRLIAQREGVRALWSGVGPACIRVGGGAGLYFLVLAQAQAALAERWPREASPGARTFALGATARAAAALALCPVTVVKTRAEYASAGAGGAGGGGGWRAFGGTAGAVAALARSEGLRGLFSGLGPTLLRDAPYSGLYLLLYTRLRGAAERARAEARAGEGCGGESGGEPGGGGQQRGWLSLSSLASLAGPAATSAAAAAAAGGVATVVTHPPDVLRTRAQLASVAAARAAAAAGMRAGAGAPAAVAAAAAAATGLGAILRAEGPGALWAGVGPRVARRCAQQALTWGLFEALAGRVDA